MELVRYAIPVALLAWFLWQARKKPLFFLGIPVLMAMYYSAFFNRLRPFWIPGRYTPQQHLVLWLAIVLVAVYVFTPAQQRRRAWAGFRRFLPEEVLLLLFAAIVGVHILDVFSRTGDLGSAIGAGSDWLLLLAGYALIRFIVSLATRDESIAFLRAVVLVNTFVAALYVLHQGIHLPIYSGREYYTTVLGGVEITRTFRFAPVFTPLALGFILAMRRWTPLWLVALAVNILALVLTYTRTLVIAAVVAVILAVVVRELRSPRMSRFLRRSLTILASIGAIIVAFRLVRPVEFQYLLERLGAVVSAGGAANVGTWEIRMSRFRLAGQALERGDPWLGFGFAGTTGTPLGQSIAQWTWDSTWLPILYYLGVVGLVLMILVVVAFGFRALLLSLSGVEQASYLGLVFVITIAMIAVMTLWGPTFLDPMISLGLWPFAFVAAEALRPVPALEGEAAAGERVRREVADASG